jgi:superfamily II DNA or RNA helicase
VHTSVLQEQWAQRVAQYLPGARVSYVRGGALDLSGDVVIAMIQTLVSRAYPPSTFDPCGLLLVDECHHVGAEVFSRAMFGLARRSIPVPRAEPSNVVRLSRPKSKKRRRK